MRPSAETDRLLDFARAARVPGGFAWLDERGRPDRGEPLRLWITARMTHVFALGHLLGRPDCAALVDHGVAALQREFADSRSGGWFAAVRDGRAVESGKGAYDHAFVLLCAAGATLAERPGAVELLGEAAAVMIDRFWSEADGACRETWDDGADYRGANANMHAVEAFLAAGDATGRPIWARRALRIAARLIDGAARRHDWRVPEHYDSAWRELPDYNADRPRDAFRPYGVMPGHGLEWARLLLGLRAALPDPPPWLLEAARGLFDRALADGWEAHGGIVYTTDFAGLPVVRDRFHWVLAEAVGAAATLAAVTGQATYRDWERRLWRFAEQHLIDHDHGGWHHELDATNRPAARTWRGKPDTYHALQATLAGRVGAAASFAGALKERSDYVPS